MKRSFRQRLYDWAGNRVASAIFAGRTKKVPERETTAYNRISRVGISGGDKKRPTPKPVPANLRNFARTVYARRAINRVKGAVVGLKWEIRPKEGVELNSELERQIEIATACFQSPNHDDSFRSLLEACITDYLICGAGAIEHALSGDQMRPLWMWPVDALSIQIYAGWNGEPGKARYLQSYSDSGSISNNKGIPLTNDQLIYVRKDPSTETPFGVGCLEIAYNSISRQLGVAAFAGELATNRQPENLLQFEGMDSVTLETFRGYWRDEVEGMGTTPIIGGETAHVHKLRGTTDEALYLMYQEFLLREIATAFEISPMNMGIETTVNRSTAEVAEERDWNAAVIPAATNFASYLTREALNGKLGFSQLEFGFLGLDRADEEILSRIQSTYYQSNVLTPNEIRARLNYEPLESEFGEMLFVETEMKAAEAGAKLQRKNETTTKPKTGDDEG